MDISEQDVYDVVNFYYSELRYRLSKGRSIKLTVTGLGFFTMKVKKLRDYKKKAEAFLAKYEKGKSAMSRAIVKQAKSDIKNLNQAEKHYEKFRKVKAECYKKKEEYRNEINRRYKIYLEEQEKNSGRNIQFPEQEGLHRAGGESEAGNL